MISEKIQKALNEQIQLEEESSRIYLDMAIWCETKGYPGAAAFLYEHSDEERMHQLKLVHYVNDRGCRTELFALPAPTADYGTLRELFEKVFSHEKHVTASINNLYGLTLEEKDYTTGQFLQWYIQEQIEEESLVGNILDKMELAGDHKGGIFHIDKELAGMAAAEAAAE